MAHTKAGGSTALGRDSQAKRLGVKLFAGEFAKPGMIIVRQRGSKYRPGQNVRPGSDDTLYAAATGFVKFSTKKITKYDGRLQNATFVHVLPNKVTAKVAAVKAPKKTETKAAAKGSKK